MSALWNSSEAEAATGGSATRVFEASGVSIDSRTLEPGDLFVALKGPNNDAHAYVPKAFERGAAAALVSDLPSPLTLPQAGPSLSPLPPGGRGEREGPACGRVRGEGSGSSV